MHTRGVRAAAGASALNAATECASPARPHAAPPHAHCAPAAHTEPAFRELVRRAAERFRSSGRIAYYFARGKLGGDPVFAALLRDGRIASDTRIVDIGCGLGVLGALLATAEQCDRHVAAQWPRNWAPPPQRWMLHGFDLRAQAIAAGQRALSDVRDRASLAAGDMRNTPLPACDLFVLLDVLHYIDHAAQQALLTNASAALAPGGTLLLRVGDAASGLRFRWSALVDGWITIMRGKWPQFHCRPLAEWVALLEAAGFAVSAQPMSEGTPFANVLVIATKR